jgi:hypothetical protein
MEVEKAGTRQVQASTEVQVVVGVELVPLLLQLEMEIQLDQRLLSVEEVFQGESYPRRRADRVAAEAVVVMGGTHPRPIQVRCKGKEAPV